MGGILFFLNKGKRKVYDKKRTADDAQAEQPEEQISTSPSRNSTDLSKTAAGVLHFAFLWRRMLLSDRQKELRLLPAFGL